ncbi:hypothetical protein K435DRAFT_915360 [Dendrothele bispora CBS 962.96]|uniref:Uncharacterized protein n=1 Tax=Dendrothele bispora (strain CBS 962.96) TaxID=1314807 RepID=A0A4S8LKM7_DENBC|nr:hypothetical protein K435DRAFT_915360 [Dendrothele bispora CBS 962.96]
MPSGNTRSSQRLREGSNKPRAQAKQKRKSAPENNAPPAKKLKEGSKTSGGKTNRSSASKTSNHGICFMFDSINTYHADMFDSSVPFSIDEPESEEDIVIIRRNPKITGNKKSVKAANRAEVIDEASTDSERESTQDSDDSEDPSVDMEAVDFFDDEAPVFVQADSEDEDTHQRNYSCSSSRASNTDFGSLPPSTDTEGVLSGVDDDNNDDVPIVQPKSRSGKKAKKLEAERPQVMHRNPIPQPAVMPSLTVASRLPTTATAVLQPAATGTPATQSGPLYSPVQPWLAHTNIGTVVKGRTTVLSTLSTQTKTIRSLIDRSIKLGKLNMLTNSTYCPVNNELKSIANASLINAAQEMELDGKNNFIQRLEEDDHNTYAKPLLNYVSHRIGLERKDLKQTQTSTVLSAFGFGNDAAGRSKAQQLVMNYTYHYASLANLTSVVSDGLLRLRGTYVVMIATGLIAGTMNVPGNGEI